MLEFIFRLFHSDYGSKLEKDIRELQDLIDTYREEGFLVNEQLLADLEILRTRLEMAK